MQVFFSISGPFSCCFGRFGLHITFSVFPPLFALFRRGSASTSRFQQSRSFLPYFWSVLGSQVFFSKPGPFLPRFGAIPLRSVFSVSGALFRSVSVRFRPASLFQHFAPFFGPFWGDPRSQAFFSVSGAVSPPKSRDAGIKGVRPPSGTGSVLPMDIEIQIAQRGRDPDYSGPPAQIRTCALTHPAPPLGRTIVHNGMIAVAD